MKLDVEQMEDNQNRNNKNQPRHSKDVEQTELLGSFLITLSDKALEMEMQRGNGLERLAAHLLTCITILSAVYLTPASSLFEYSYKSQSIPSLSPTPLAWLYFLSLAPLLIALLITLSSLYKRKVLVFSSPRMQQDYVSEIKQRLESGFTGDTFNRFPMACAYSSALEDHYCGVHAKNDKMWSRLKIAMFLIMTSVSFALVGGFVLFVQFA